MSNDRNENEVNNDFLSKNLEYIRSIFGSAYPQERFAAEVLDISKNSYTNYVSHNQNPKLSTQINIVTKLNDKISKNADAKNIFQQPITLEQLTTTYLNPIISGPTTTQIKIYTEKFVGNYLCYYTSTNPGGEKRKNFGVISLKPGIKDNEFITYGSFDIKTLDEAVELYDKAEENIPFEDILTDPCKCFKGTSYISTTLLWCTLSNEIKTSHISLSFDLSLKTTTKQTARSFIGTRGISLFQTSGQNTQTTTFPIVIIKKLLEASPNELTNYLKFNYSVIPNEALKKLAHKATKLMIDTQELDVSEDFKEKIISTFIENEIKDLLTKHVFNSHYYTSEEMDEFYKKIIKPLRDTSFKYSND